MDKVASKWTWLFSSGGFIDVYRESHVSPCVRLSLDYKQKFHISRSYSYLNDDDWEHVLKCLKEAKAVLKKIRKI